MEFKKKSTLFSTGDTTRSPATPKAKGCERHTLLNPAARGNRSPRDSPLCRRFSVNAVGMLTQLNRLLHPSYKLGYFDP